VRRQSGLFKAVVDAAKEAFYTSKESKLLEDSDDSASPSEDESNDFAVVSCSVGDDVVAQTDFGGVFRPCGYKRDGKWEAISQSRKKEERKWRKAGEDDPTYVPEDTVPKKQTKKSNTVSNNKSAGDFVSNVSFVFLLFSIPYLMNSSNI
jgi:hypothetical protein